TDDAKVTQVIHVDHVLCDRYLGVASLAGAVQDTSTCNEVPGLVLAQQEVCRKNPESILCISEGARRGILECQEQFKYERWNCTASATYKVFGPILRRGTKETAFIYAILSAGVVHSVTQACSAGNLTECSCDMSRYGEADVEGWKWGGCSDNVNYGLWFAQNFVDAPETIRHENSRNIRNLMNLHNNEVGRNAPYLNERIVVFGIADIQPSLKAHRRYPENAVILPGCFVPEATPLGVSLHWCPPCAFLTFVGELNVQRAPLTAGTMARECSSVVGVHGRHAPGRLGKTRSEESIAVTRPPRNSYRQTALLLSEYRSPALELCQLVEGDPLFGCYVSNLW
ncbi:hypothetical protein BaRGS_00005380, partial [Batillaria attramentaria]